MNLKRLLTLKPIIGKKTDGKNLLDTRKVYYAKSIDEVGVGYVYNDKVGSGNADYIIFDQEFEPGTYCLSAKKEGPGYADRPIRILSSEPFRGASYISYYQGYVKDMVLSSDGDTYFIAYDFTTTFMLGFIFMTKAGAGDYSEWARIYDIQLERGTSPTPYVPYGQ